MSVYIVKAQKTKLRGNLSVSATQVILDNLIDSKGNAISMASFGEWFVLVVKQGTKIEMIKCDGLTQNGNGSATCDVATNGRDLQPVYPYTGSASGEDFLSGAEVIITNDPVTVMYYMLSNDNTWTGINQFSQVPNIMANAVVSTGAVRKAQLDSALLGVATSVSVVVEGVAGETISDGQLIYFDFTVDAWLKCDADTASTVNNVLLGIAQGSATIGNLIANGVLLRGTDDAQSGMTTGNIMYASNTAGGISASAGTTPIAVGIAKNATQLYFEPSFNTKLSQNQINAINGANNPSGSNVFITANDTSATPSANIIPKADANGTLNSFVTGLNTTFLAGETLAVGNPVYAGMYQSDGGIVYKTQGTFSGASGGTTINQNITTVSGSNNILVVYITTYGTTPSPTFNSVAMTQAGTAQTLTGGMTGYYYYLLNPYIGTANLQFSNTNLNNWSFAFVQYANVAQVAPDASSSSATNSASITPVSDGDFLLGCAMSNQAGTTPSSPVNFGNNNQSIGSGNGGRILTGDSGRILSRVPITMSATNATAVFLLAIKPVTTPSMNYCMKTQATTPTGGVASENKYNSFAGIVTGITGGGVVGTTTTVQHTGIVTGLTGLIPFTTYYISDTLGVLSYTAGTNSKKIGLALSTTTLLLKNDN